MSRRSLWDETDAADHGEPLVPPRRRLDGEIDLTSLIDVVFQLLIFFMVASTMRGTPDVDLPEAHFGTGVPSKMATIITIRRPAPGEPPVVLLGDGQGPEAPVDSVRDFVEQNLQLDARRSQIIIKAERDIPTGFVQRVAKQFADIPGLEFHIGVQEKR